MKKYLLIMLMSFVLFSCGNKKEKAVMQTEVVVAAIDSLQELDSDVDSIVEYTEPEPPEPVSLDEFFEDFIFHFAADATFQKRRIAFPLSYYQTDTVLKIERNDWMHDSLFYNNTYYTLLADKEDDLELLGDTSRNSVQVEWILMEELQAKRYYFERISGRWMLEAINLRPLTVDGHSDFIDFFIHFATDSLFQISHIHDPLEFVTTDPDDDFSVLEAILDPNQWLAFKPELPSSRLSNIDYGQRNEDKSREKILQIKGIGNGFLNTLFFRKRGGKWELYKFEDTSN